MSKDTNDILSTLHTKLSEHLLDKINKGNLTAAELNVIRQFLKDNHISDIPRANSPYGDLLNSFSFTEEDDAYPSH